MKESSSESRENSGPGEESTLEPLLRRLYCIENGENRLEVESYLYEAINHLKPGTLHSRLDALAALARQLGNRTWKDATRQDVVRTISGHTFQKGAHRGREASRLPKRGLAASTKYQWSIHIRTFYQWLLETDDVPPPCRRLPFKKADAMAQRGKQMALEPEEVRQILSGANSTRDRFTILFLVETGLRASEAAAVRLDGIERRNHGYWISLPDGASNLKTGPREVQIPIISAASAYEAWLAEHPRRLEADAPLLVTLSHRSYGNPMTGKTVSQVVVRCAKRAGMRHVHAHMLRHTSATLKIAKGMEPEAIRLIHGWTKRSTMLSYYAHVKPHFERLVLKAHDLPSDEKEIIDIMGAQPCALCGAKNTIDATTCSACGIRLSEAAQSSARHQREQQLLAYIAPHAVRNLQGVLFTAVATAMGWKPKHVEAMT